MSEIISALTAGGIVVAATLSGGAVHAQRSAGLNTTQTIQISAATKTLDLGADGNAQTPPNWTQTDFDDSSWTPASTMASTCTTNSDYSGYYQSIGSPSAIYWGSTPSDAYLFRQDFTLPSAKSYYGSTLYFGLVAENTFNNQPDSMIYLNGQKVDEPDERNGGSVSVRDAVGQYLRAGQNVLAISTPAGYSGCGALSFTLNLHITDVQTSAPSPAPTKMSTMLPGQNAVLTGNRLPFTWNRFAGASYYYLQMWLDNAGPGQRITSRTTTTYTTRLTGTSYTLDVGRFAKGTYSWRMVAVGGADNLLTVWTPDQTVTLR